MNIKELVDFIVANNGNASIDDFAKYFQHKYRMYVDSSYKSAIKKELNNSNKVRFNKLLNVWELNRVVEPNKKVLKVSEYRYFNTIREAMYELFGMRVSSGGAYFKIAGSSDYAWFPKFNNANPNWTNTLSEDGRIWREKPNTQDANNVEINRPLEEHRRYAFAFDKVGNKHKYRFTGIFKQIKVEDDGTRVYEIVDDSIEIKNHFINLLVCNISYMKEYKGITNDDPIIPSGKYPNEHKDGGEKFNFLPREDGFVYGFVETNYKDSKEHMGDADYAKNITLENINPIFNKKYEAENVRVVFISQGQHKHHVVVGWYDNATVFRKRQKIDNQEFGYNIRVKAEDAHLIKDEERTFEFIKINEDQSYNFGQSFVAYPYTSGKESTIAIADKVNKYIDDMLNSKVNLYYEPVNLNQWPMFDLVKGVGHEEHFLATKTMKPGDFILCHVGQQDSKYESGIYAVAQVITKPEVLNIEDTEEYCNGKLSVNTKFVKYSTEPLLTHDEYSHYDGMFRTVHKISDEYTEELLEIFRLK